MPPKEKDSVGSVLSKEDLYLAIANAQVADEFGEERTREERDEQLCFGCHSY